MSADLLAQSTRRRLLGLFAELGGSASTGQLAARLAMHPNGIRAHLTRMEAGGLVVRRRVPQPRGRPRDQWAVSPAASAPGEELEAYRTVARWLARSVPATPRRLRDIERTGIEIGRELAPAASAAPAQAMEDILAALGFQPQVERTAGGDLICRLGNCPYSDSVRQNQPVVCMLHRGITRGVLEQVAPGATLERFVPHDPDRAGCEIDIAGLAPAA